MNLVHSDPEFYAPLSRSTRRGTEYAPAGVPAGWQRQDEGVWTYWYPEHKLGGVTDGWKVHVSARIGRAQHVLDTAAAVFTAHGVAFKHLSCSTFFILTHHKHAARSQAGKFCAAYPPDADTAAAVMAELSEALRGEEGPYVLTDRRFGDSQVVHYRYGAYTARGRLRPEGFQEWLVRDGSGQDVLDVRGVRFQVPEGIVDPFAPDEEPAAARGGAPEFDGVRFEKVLRHSNGGGAYRGTEVGTGREVFIKEARGHNGLVSTTSCSQDRLRNEHEVLVRLHELDPGLAPEPVRYFRRLENEFLVTEFVTGTSLRSWWVAHNPVIWAVATEADYRAYYDRAWRVLDQLAALLDRVHAAGYAFVDLSPDNVLVGDDDTIRLIDFETAAPLGAPLATPIGTPGFFPADPRRFVDDPVRYDEYGLSSIALALIAPLNTTADLNPGVLAHLRAQLDPRGLVPERVWALATRFREPVAAPAPAEVAADPRAHLAALRDGIVAGLSSADHRDGVVPLGPQSYATNALGLAHGLAGVVHALGVAGAPAPGLVDRLVAGATEQVDELAPGLLVGQAGIAWALADSGRVAEAEALLARADEHPLLDRSATLGLGRAGVGLAHLALHRHTGDPRHLDRALEQADRIPRGAELSALVGPDDTTGLFHGRAGIALLDYYLARVTGSTDRFDAGLALLHAELERALPVEGGLLFPVSTRDHRVMPYLSTGSAGFGLVASRYLATERDERLAAAMPGLVAGMGSEFTHYGGLAAGMAGLVLFLRDHGARHADAAACERAERLAQRLFLFAVPHPTGTYVPGEHALRLSGDLAFGSAGVLVVLSHLLDGAADPFLTLDGLVGAPAAAPV
ncbi:class III lanthionine synthetase LanKC [Actinokineospora bangkokensis]|uniref:Protein kinase domain-containing protein n=1 Tax=Actinokineospora bangkokensis TaxID=1193682 RepID=A0A1Q9LLI9_9PSEU|nr:class III lanthionine synthetase LanKC [Actinokineospora bangkokensis]OLR92863.1 hypothetical protein BJP25_19720 [Actinokineospora bangkokensis]